jgi:hypothetical protein
MMDCPDCGANLAIVGRMHRCVAKPVSNGSPAKSMANSMANASHVANEDMANRPMKPRSLTPGTTTYRYRNTDQRRIYMRDLTREIRARKKEDAA